MLLDSARSGWKNVSPPHPAHPSGKETGNKTVSSLFTDGGEGGLATCFSLVRVDFQIRDYIPRVVQRAQPPLISCSSSAVFFSLAVCGPQDGSVSRPGPSYSPLHPRPSVLWNTAGSSGWMLSL